MNTKKKKTYRPNVGAIIMSNYYPSKCEFFLGERSDLKGIWQFPQGGIEKDETPYDALLRELKEEIGTAEIEVIAEYPNWIHYDFPSHIAQKMQPFDGQIQKYFLVKLKKHAIINIHTESPEFANYEFVGLEVLRKKIVGFKKDVYFEVLDHFKKGGYL